MSAKQLKNTPDDYLRTIWALSFPTGDPSVRLRGPRPTAAATIARRLGVSRASCGEMLARLEQRGMITRGARKEAVLTAAGRDAAMQLVRNIRIVECMAVDVLGYAPHEAHAHARQLVEGFCDDAVERLYRRLGEPIRSPQGTPIDPDFELREGATLRSLALIPAGVDAHVVRTEVEDPELAEALAQAGIVPGTTVRVVPPSSLGKPMTVSVDGADPAGVPVAALGRCFVRTDGDPEVPATAACWASTVAGKVRS